MSQVKHTMGPWTINPHKGVYSVVGTLAPDHQREREAIIKRLGKDRFEALSIGTSSCQVAIIPLDESSEANASLIRAAPDLLEIAEIIEKVYSAGPAETFHTRVRELAGGDFAGVLMAALDKARAA